MTASFTRRLQSRPLKAYLILLVVIFSAATTPIFIRNAQQAGVPSLYIIAVRLVIVSLVLAPLVLKRHRAKLGQLTGREWLLVVASGFFFALNLLMLFVSLEYTSVLVTSVIRRTTPLWVSGLEIALFGVVFTRKFWAGLLFTFGGTVLVGLATGGAIQPGSQPLLGAALALLGSVSIGLYLLIGRRFRLSLPSLAYSWLVFTWAALLSVGAILVTGTPLFGYSLTGYFWILVITIVAQFLGHIPINMGLQYFHATYMSVTLQLSVGVSALLALIIFNEVPSLWQIAGSVAILLGVLLVSWK